MRILTTDTRPKISMEECVIAGVPVKIYGVAKGSGMIHPDITTLGFVFTDAKISGKILKQLLKKIFKTLLMLSAAMVIQVQMIW